MSILDCSKISKSNFRALPFSVPIFILSKFDAIQSQGSVSVVERGQTRMNFMTVVDIFLFLSGLRRGLYCLLCYARSRCLTVTFIIPLPFPASYIIMAEMVCPQIQCLFYQDESLFFFNTYRSTEFE